MTPDVTVGIPFHDEEEGLARAVTSVLGQRTDAKLEVLLVDDGSTDASVRIARSFRDPRVRVLVDGQRRHLAARLNQIVREARAPLVARMDADDLSHPERIARQLALLDRARRVDAVGTWAAYVDASTGTALGVVETHALPPTRASAIRHGILTHATMVARRSWLLANPYDEALLRTEDRDLWARTATSARFDVVPEVLYVIRAAVGGEVILDDYLASHREYRRLLLRHGESLAWTARLVIVSHAKAIVFRAGARLGVVHRLVQRRGRPPTAAERMRIEEALAAAQRA